MKKTIYLKIEYQELKDKEISLLDQEKFKQKTFKTALNVFKTEFKDLIDSKQLKILSEMFPEIIIEYKDDQNIYNRLVKSDIVLTIDSQIYRK